MPTPGVLPARLPITIGGIFSALALLLAASTALPLQAQSQSQYSQPHRFEKPQKLSEDRYNIIPLGTEGIALVRERDKYQSNNKMWELLLLDSALREVKTIDIQVNVRNKMVGYEVTPDHLFLLFRMGETTKNDLQIIDVNMAAGESTDHHMKPDLDFKLTHFIKAGDNFVFGGYVNNEPAVILFELANNHIRVIPGFFQKDTELVDLRTNQNQTFNTVLIDRGGNKENRKLIFRTFDDTGKQLLEDIVPIDDNKSLQTGITSVLQREDLGIAGTWGERNSKQSIGFYFLTIDPFKDQKIHFLDVAQLNHYLDYMNPKRAARIKENSKADTDAGRIPNFTSYVMPYRMMEYQSGYLLLAEVYTPVSSMSPYYNNPYYYNPYYSPYGMNPYYPSGFYYPGMRGMYRPYSYGSNVRNVDEIKTNAAVLIAFDPQGKVLWDQSFKLDEAKAPSVEQISDFLLQDGKLHMLYKKESELKFKTVMLDTDQSAEVTEKIKLDDPVDEIRSEKDTEGGVRHWYGNAFYVWGYQTIRNVSKADRTRDVFYINKVVVH